MNKSYTEEYRLSEHSRHVYNTEETEINWKTLQGNSLLGGKLKL